MRPATIFAPAGVSIGQGEVTPAQATSRSVSLPPALGRCRPRGQLGPAPGLPSPRNGAVRVPSSRATPGPLSGRPGPGCGSGTWSRPGDISPFANPAVPHSSRRRSARGRSPRRPSVPRDRPSPAAACPGRAGTPRRCGPAGHEFGNPAGSGQEELLGRVGEREDRAVPQVVEVGVGPCGDRGHRGVLGPHEDLVLLERRPCGADLGGDEFRGEEHLRTAQVHRVVVQEEPGALMQLGRAWSISSAGIERCSGTRASTIRTEFEPDAAIPRTRSPPQSSRTV